MNRLLRCLPVVSVILGTVLYVPYVFAETEEKPVITKPAIDVSAQKALRDEVIYRTNLGRSSDVKILIEKGASIDETNNSKVPLISLASSRSDSEGLQIVKMLVESGADINKADARGKNALFYAAKIGNKDIVEYLLANKIHYSAVDSAGNNARIIAYQTGNNEIVEILDNFVRGQNDVVKKQYEEANKEIAERYKEYNKKLQDQIKKNSDEQNAIKLATSKAAVIQETVHNLSFASCSSAYWQFCSSVRQQTELGEQNLTNNIVSQSGRAREFMASLVNLYLIRNDVAENIRAVSMDSIKNQLAGFSSNEVRKEEGIGTVEDMTRRCNLIADTWQATPKSFNETIFR